MGEKLTVDEAAAQLRMKRESLRGWVRLGKIPAVRVGKRYLIDQDDVDRILRDGTRAVRTPSPARAE